MDRNEHDKITIFDTLFTTNHIQIMKILMPCLSQAQQKQIAVLIKYMEFQYTITCFQSQPPELCSCSGYAEELDIGKICSEVLPYCTTEEKQKVEQIAGMLRSMKMYKEMSKTMEMVKELFPDGFGDSSPFNMSQGGNSESSAAPMGGGMMDMLMNMLSPEQKAMFEMFSPPQAASPED